MGISLMIATQEAIVLSDFEAEPLFEAIDLVLVPVLLFLQVR